MLIQPKKILIIQTAFLGDVVLATSLIEKVIEAFPQSEISVLVRSGAEDLLKYHPKIKKVFVWVKKSKKFSNLWKLLKEIRKEQFDVVMNIQRFFSSGLLTICSKAKYTFGFKSNPWSFAFSKALPHLVPMKREGALSIEDNFYHEVQRNYQLLIALKEMMGETLPMLEKMNLKPKLYFGHEGLNGSGNEKRSYVVIAPTSVWYTKQWAKEKWIELLKQLPEEVSIFLVGSNDDFHFCQDLILSSQRKLVANTCGKLSLLQTALLMKNAKRVFCNDSAPSHLASAINAPQTVIFCSTVEEFGFGPLSDDSKVISVSNLSCRPCGIHGKKQCPKKHFKCSNDIDVSLVMETLN